MGHMGTSITVLVLMVLFSATISTAQDFKCTNPARCTALVGYPSPNKTSIGEIQSLFSIKHLHSILGANNLSLSTSRNLTIQAQQVVRIPIPCVCRNNTGASYNMPVYTIKKDDGLYHIAQDVFAGLVQYERIQDYNNITNPNLIIEGDSLTIPLPCSCDDVKGDKVVHYTHVVQPGSTLESISQQFGTTKDILAELNGGIDNSKLIADTPIDVPLQACKSSIRNDSFDSILRVANGSYVLTAKTCVKCKCDAAANNSTLQCEPSLYNLSNPCPSMACEGSNNLLIGNTTSNGCNQMSCAYAGYANQTIFTTLESLSTCPAPSPNNNGASRIALNRNLFIVSIHLVLLYLYVSH